MNPGAARANQGHARQNGQYWTQIYAFIPARTWLAGEVWP